MMRLLVALIVLAVCTVISWNAAAEEGDWIAAIVFFGGLVLLAYFGYRTGERWVVALPLGPLLVLAAVGLADEHPPRSWGDLWLANLIFAAALTAGALGVGCALRVRRVANRQRHTAALPGRASVSARVPKRPPGDEAQ